MAQQLPPQRHVHAADVAQAMLNLVFMQTGRFFVDPALRDSNRTHNGIKVVFPTALNNYHQALDELEVKIARAQQTMRRDLALLQAAREQKEAEEAEKERVHAQVPAVQQEPVSDTAPTAVVEQEADPVIEDVEMQDTVMPKVEATTPAATQNEVKQPSPPTTQSTQTVPPTKPPPIQTQSTDKDEKSTDVEAGPLTATGTDDLFERTPTTAGVNHFDLDSMFGNTADAQNLESNNADDIDFGLDDHAAGGSLLQGIEDFANTSSDLNMNDNNALNDLMLDLPSELDTTVPMSGDASTSQAISQPPQTQGETSATDFAASNFHDLFGQGDYDLDLEDGLLAPENTAFEDAWDFGDD